MKIFWRSSMEMNFSVKTQQSTWVRCFQLYWQWNQIKSIESSSFWKFRLFCFTIRIRSWKSHSWSFLKVIKWSWTPTSRDTLKKNLWPTSVTVWKLTTTWFTENFNLRWSTTRKLKLKSATLNKWSFWLFKRCFVPLNLTAMRSWLMRSWSCWSGTSATFTRSFWMPRKLTKALQVPNLSRSTKSKLWTKSAKSRSANHRRSLSSTFSLTKQCCSIDSVSRIRTKWQSSLKSSAMSSSQTKILPNSRHNIDQRSQLNSKMFCQLAVYAMRCLKLSRKFPWMTQIVWTFWRFSSSKKVRRKIFTFGCLKC